jgi:hypothetical protein
VADEPKTCANCGHLQATGAFCEACGTKLPPPGPAAVTPPPPPPASTVEPVSPSPAPLPPIAPQAGYAAQPQYVSPPPPPPPPAQNAYPAPSPYGPGASAQVPGYAAYQPPNAFEDYIAFRKLITPALVQIAFWLFEGINLFYWIRFIYYGRSSALEIIFGLFALFITALLIRILMETVITIFRGRS